MQYICLVYQDERNLCALSDDALDTLVAECGAWVQELESGGHHVFSAGLQSVRTAATLRNRIGKTTMTDGPFAETKEFLGGFTIIDARDLNEAIQLASKLPAARIGSVEVRPVLDIDADTTDPLDRKLAASIRRSSHQQSGPTAIESRQGDKNVEDSISQAKADYLRAKESLCRALAATPDARINWSPSPTSRTPIQLVAHAAEAVKNINAFLDGRPFTLGPAEADRYFRESERQFSTREEVLGLLDQISAEYVAWLDALTPDRLDSLVELPFGFGSAPISVGLTFAPAHTRNHAAQIEYVQTIYGDRDWHLPA